MSGQAAIPGILVLVVGPSGAGDFLLNWRAHGLDYTLPIGVAVDLAAGCTVVASVSRTVIENARRNYAPVRVVNVTAAPAVLAARLPARGRESAAEIEARLAREAALA